MVLLSHLPEATGLLAPLRPLQAVGHTGVGLFLVLSGFSIHYRWAQRREEGGGFEQRRFWRRRFWRLYPTYVGAVVVTALILGALGEIPDVQWQFASSDVPFVLLILSQITLVGVNIVGVPFVGVAWSLALEIQLYAAYAAFISRLRRIGVWRIVAASLGVALVWRVGAQFVTTSMPVGQFFPDGSATLESRVLYAQIPARWFEWMLGLMAAEMYWGHLRRPTPRQCFAIALGGLLAATFLFRVQQGSATLNGHPFFLSDVLLDPLFGVGYVALLAAGIFSTHAAARLRPVLQPLAFVGLFSYSLYLLHRALVTLFDHILPQSTPYTLRVAMLGASAIVGAWASFHVVERRYLFPRNEPKQRPRVSGRAPGE